MQDSKCQAIKVVFLANMKENSPTLNEKSETAEAGLGGSI